MTRHDRSAGDYQPDAAGIGTPRTDAGWRLPCGLLPRLVATHPQHVPSTCVFFRRLPDEVTSFGGRRPRWLRIALTVCACGASFGRTTCATPGDYGTDLPVTARRGLDDVHVRGNHASHVLRVGAQAREVAA